MSGRSTIAGYVLGGLLAAAALGGAIAWVVVGLIGFGDAVDALHRIPIGAARTVHLESGRQGIYYEGPGGEKAALPSLRFVIGPAGGGAPIAVGGYSGSVTYSVNSHAGRSIAGFGVGSAGAYRIAVIGRAPGQVAIGPGIGHRIVRAIVGGVIIFMGGMLLAGGLIAFTATRRAKP